VAACDADYNATLMELGEVSQVITRLSAICRGEIPAAHPRD
jgi:hypothetical protein